MKVLYINDELISSDGSNAHALGLYKSFVEINGEKNVLALPEVIDGSRLKVHGKAIVCKNKYKNLLQVIKYYRKSALSYKRSYTYYRELQKKGFKPDVIIARATSYDFTATLLARKLKAKLIYEVNTPAYYESAVIRKQPMRKQNERWEKDILCKSDIVYSVSNTCSKMLSEYYSVDISKFVTIPNGYMKDLYEDTDKEKELLRIETRKELSLNNEILITFLGSLKVWHGINQFCELAKLLSYRKDICFLVVGDGEMRDEIERYISTNDNMRFVGKVAYDKMKEYLYASDLGVMPYEKSDNFYFSPLKMYDMIGAGLPFIGTKIGQISEVIELALSDDFALDSNNPKMMKSKVEYLVDNQELLGAMKMKIKAYRENCTWYSRGNMLIERVVDMETSL